MAVNASDFPRHAGSGQQSVKSSARLSGMTSTPLSPPVRIPTAPGVTGGTHEGGVGPSVWHIASCFRCAGGPDLGEPFREQGDRDDWAAKHVGDTGHTVTLSVDAEPDPTDAYPADRWPPRVVTRTPDGTGSQFQCTGDGRYCRRWNGPYVSPQLAIASACSHRCVVS